MAKRLFDLILSVIGLIILSPAFVIISCWIKLDSTGPVFFRQERVGLNGNIFRIHKFRTMRPDSESKGKLTIGADVRITKSGHFLRRYKIDELPQLLDVFIGSMSLVGPRPEVKEFMDNYDENVREKILSIKPGITDRASIEMVDENDILEKYDDPKYAYINYIMPIKETYYLEYVNNNSIVGDLCIIWATFIKIVFR